MPVKKRKNLPKKNSIYQSSGGKIIAEVETSKISDVFGHLFGRKNSRSKLYNKRIIINFDDIKELHELIQKKLGQYTISGYIFDSIIEYSDNEVEEIDKWENFVDKSWNTSDTTDALTLKWQFLIEDPTTKQQLYYCIVIQLSSPPNPLQIMRHILSKNPEDLSTSDNIHYAKMSCRVDYVDSLLSKELLAVVSSWNKALRSTSFNFPGIEFISKYENSISLIIKYSIPLFFSLLIFSMYLNFTQPESPQSAPSSYFMRENIIWLFGMVVGFYSSVVLGRFISRYSTVKIYEIQRSDMFELTNGDQNKITNSYSKKSKSIWKLIGTVALTLLTNATAGIIAIIYYKIF